MEFLRIKGATTWEAVRLAPIGQLLMCCTDTVNPAQYAAGFIVALLLNPVKTTAEKDDWLATGHSLLPPSPWL